MMDDPNVRIQIVYAMLLLMALAIVVADLMPPRKKQKHSSK